MANLKSGIELTVDNCFTDIFEAESGGHILEVLLVEDDKTLLVKEVLPGGLGYAFFDVKTGLKIDSQHRFKQCDGKVFERSFSDDLQAVMKVSVDSSNGVEIVTYYVRDRDVVLYQGQRERYPDRSFDDLYNKFLDHQESQKKELKCISELTDTFVRSSIDEQAALLRGEFRSKWRSNNELGFEYPERFLTKELYESLKKAPTFYDALKFMLVKECELIGESSEKLYESILQYYENRKSVE